MEYAVTTNCLTKQFKRVKAVDSVSLHVKRGEIYGFIGRNGAGKTTCMKMICGLASATSGEVSLFGHSGAEVKNYYGRIGNLIENPGLYMNMTALQNVEAKCVLLGIHKKGYAKELLEFVGLGDTGKKKVKSFSLGMKQRLGIALALVGEPDMLVLDEPINGLDPQGIVEVRETLLKLNKEKNLTIMISSHILEELSKIADTYGIIHEGHLLMELSREELNSKCMSYVEIITNDAQKACVILESLGLTQIKVVNQNTVCVYEHLEGTPTMNRQLITGGCEVAQIRVVMGELEDFYLGITGGAYHA